MWVEFGNKFHEVCDEFHERSEWNSRKRVKFISEFHEQGVDSYIITWITKNEKFTLFTGNYWIWETFLRSYAWDRGDLRNFPPRSNISPKLRNSLEKWRMGLRLTPLWLWRQWFERQSNGLHQPIPWNSGINSTGVLNPDWLTTHTHAIML